MIDPTRFLRGDRRHRRRLPLLAALLAGAGLIAGCSTYQEHPLAAAEAAPTASEVAAVRVAAAALQHPLLAPVKIDGRDGFTPEEIAVMTVITSPRLRAVRAQRGVAQAQVMQAGLLPNPQLGYTLDHPTDPGYVNGKSLGLSWDLTALLGYRDRVAAARASTGALDLDIAWQEWQAAQGARLSAYHLLSLDEQLPLAREAEAVQAEALGLTQKAQALGERTTADVIAARDAWSQAQDQRLALEQERATEALNLRLSLGLPADAPLPLKPGPVAVPAVPDAGNADVLLAGLEMRRLDLRALVLGYQSSEASLRAAVKSQFPRIGISVSKARDTSDVRTRGFGATVDLPLFDRNQGQIAAATASREQLFAEYTARVAEAKGEVRQLLENVRVVTQQLHTITEELPELEQLARSLDRALQTRNAEAQAARDARVALLTRRTEQARLRQDLLDLGVALEIATARPLLVGNGAH